VTLGERLMEIVRRIRTLNEEGKRTSIPFSDTIYRKLLSDLCESEDRMRFYLRVLSDAHYLFTIRLVEPDERLLIHGLEAYVVCDVPVIMRLKEVSYSELELSYEGQYYKRKQATLILRELIGNARQFNNTPLGKSMNLAMMLQQYEQFMATRFAEFSEGWKQKKLNELLPEVGFDLGSTSAAAASTKTEAQPRRAIDSEHLQKIEEMNRSGKWGEAVDKFGVQFLIRIHLRKYEFEQIKTLIKQHKIATEKDLRFLRDTLKMMEGRFEEDPELVKHKDEMIELRRLAQLKMNQVLIARKEFESQGN
jgi:hypothetical protein